MPSIGAAERRRQDPGLSPDPLGSPHRDVVIVGVAYAPIASVPAAPIPCSRSQPVRRRLPAPPLVVTAPSPWAHRDIRVGFAEAVADSRRHAVARVTMSVPAGGVKRAGGGANLNTSPAFWLVGILDAVGAVSASALRCRCPHACRRSRSAPHRSRPSTRSRRSCWRPSLKNAR
jgi:hypothetical protein